MTTPLWTDRIDSDSMSSNRAVTQIVQSPLVKLYTMAKKLLFNKVDTLHYFLTVYTNLQNINTKP